MQEARNPLFITSNLPSENRRLHVTCQTLFSCSIGLPLSLLPRSTNTKMTRMEEVFNWKRIEYQFRNNAHRQQMIESGQFVPGNSVPTSIALWSTKIFMTTPRFKQGVPATISYIHSNSTGKAYSESETESHRSANHINNFRSFSR